MKVSIIIPCYNVEHDLLERCVKSVLAQTYTKYEVILVNDGSAEIYTEHLSDVSLLDSRIILLHQNNQGVSVARNNGTQRATGEYLCYVDADDVLMPTFLEESVQIAKNYKADVVIGGNGYIGNNYKTETNKYSVDVYKKNDIRSLYPYMVGNRLLSLENGVAVWQGPWTRLIYTDIAKKVLFDTELAIGEDIVWNYKLLDNTKTVCIAHRLWYLYYLNPDSASRRYRENAIEVSKKSLNQIKDCLNLDNNDEYRSFCFRCLSDLKRLYYTHYAFKKGLIASVINVKEFSCKPWSEAKSWRFFKLCNYREKMIWIMYRFRAMFIYYKIKDMFGK